MAQTLESPRHGAPSKRLHGAGGAPAFRGGGSVGIRSNPMATMMKSAPRELHGYISETSERSDVQTGSPLPLGTQEKGGGVNFAIFSRWASRVRLELFDDPEDACARPGNRSGFSAQPHRRRMARLGKRDRLRPILCLPRGWPLRTQRRTSFQFQPASSRSLRHRDFTASPVGFCIGTWIRPICRRSRTWLSRSWTIPGRCRNAFLSTSPSSGLETSRPGIRGRRPSFTKRMFAALPFTPSRAWTIREPTEA